MSFTVGTELGLLGGCPVGHAEVPLANAAPGCQEPNPAKKPPQCFDPCGQTDLVIPFLSQQETCQ